MSLSYLTWCHLCKCTCRSLGSHSCTEPRCHCGCHREFNKCFPIQVTLQVFVDHECQRALRHWLGEPAVGTSHSHSRASFFTFYAPCRSRGQLPGLHRKSAVGKNLHFVDTLSHFVQASICHVGQCHGHEVCVLSYLFPYSCSQDIILCMVSSRISCMKVVHVMYQSARLYRFSRTPTQQLVAFVG